MQNWILHKLIDYGWLTAAYFVLDLERDDIVNEFIISPPCRSACYPPQKGKINHDRAMVEGEYYHPCLCPHDLLMRRFAMRLKIRVCNS